MADNKTSEKKSSAKADPNASPPKTKIGLIGGALVLIGASWFIWDTCLRAETKAEKTERLDREKQEAFEKRQEAKREAAKREAARVK